MKFKIINFTGNGYFMSQIIEIIMKWEIFNNKKALEFILIFSLISTSVANAQWNTKTVDWSKNPHPQIGDWGFDRPGYPKGLYIQGVTVMQGDSVINPIIYDNDVYDDVFDDELIYVMASLGELNLTALIITPVLTDFWGFSKPEWIKTATESRNYAQSSGINMKRIPPITIGTEAENEKAGEQKESAGAYLYVRIINDWYERHPDRPVLINIGGQSATLASAFCIDPGIADKCIVYYTDVRVYNGHYQWASRLITQHFRVISWGDDNWWITKKAQNQWRVLPCPEYPEGKDNNEMSGEWKLFTEMQVPLLEHMIYQFQNRNEYCCGERKGDGYLDGTFIHAWLPGIFSDAEIKHIRGGNVIHITRFDEENEALVKSFTFQKFLNPKAYLQEE